MLGPRLGPQTKEVAAAITELSHDAISKLLDGSQLELAGSVLTAEDIVVRRQPREGLVVAADGPLSVALDVTITPELAAEGTAREFVSAIQGLRRDLGQHMTANWPTPSPTSRT